MTLDPNSVHYLNWGKLVAWVWPVMWHACCTIHVFVHTGSSFYHVVNINNSVKRNWQQRLNLILTKSNIGIRHDMEVDWDVALELSSRIRFY